MKAVNKHIRLLLINCFAPAVMLGQTATIADIGGSALPANNVILGTSSHIVMQFSIAATGGNIRYTGTQFFPNGNCVLPTDITNFKLWISPDATFNASDTLVSTYNTAGNPNGGLVNFPAFSPATKFITNGVTRYMFITADIAPGGTSGRTIRLSQIYSGNITTNGTEAGSTSGPGTQTLVMPSITLANNGSQPAAANVAPGATDYILHQTSLTVASANATLTGMQCASLGTYQSADITNLKVRYSTDATLDAGDATLSTYPSPATTGTLTFPLFTSQIITTGTTGYIFITADIAAGATVTRTIYLNAITTAHLTFAVGNKFGSSTTGFAQTIAAPVINIADNSQVTAASVAQGTNTHVLNKIAVGVSTASATLTGLQCVTAGTYIITDITSLQAWYSSDNTLDVSDALLGSIANPGVAGTKTFPAFSQTINTGTVGYIFITADIFPGASAGRTIRVNAIVSGDLTFTSGSKSSTATIGGVQTFSGYTYTNIYVVSSNADAGAGSLREAIGFANGSAGRDYIYFNLGAGPTTITLTSFTTFGTSHNCALTLTDNSGVTIDGFTNRGNYGTANSVPVASASTSTPMNPSYKVILTTNNTFHTIFHLNSNNNIIKGFVITNYGDSPVDLRDIGILIGGNSNQVLGCLIGTNAAGTTIGGSYEATTIYIYGSNNIIGDGTAAGANLISGTAWTHANLRINYHTPQGNAGAGCSGNSIKGNIIGLQIDGTNYIAASTSSTGIGIGSTGGPASNTAIGGASAGEGNIISGNATGIILYADATGTSIYGNIIGPCADGATYVPSNPQHTGIYIEGGSNTIGGTTANHRNIISGNETYGISMSGTSAINNIIKGNYIGPSGSLANFIPTPSSGSETRASGSGIIELMGTSNQDYGISIISGARNNTIGGILAGEANTIAFNTTMGIRVSGATSTGNKISGNPIYSNSGKPIDLSATGNNVKASPAISSSSTITSISGTAAAGDVVEVFKNNTNNDYDATTYLGSATANGAGNWTLAVALSGAVFNYVIATATDASNNTSEFSTRITTLPIELIDFTAQCDNNKVQIKWTTTSETNNDFFTIERTSNGTEDKKEFIVDGAGNSSATKKYIFIDDQPLPGTSYYRLKQTDYDGKFEYFDFVATSCNNEEFGEFNIYPNPNGGNNFSLSIPSTKDTEVLVVLYDVNGKETYSKIILSEIDGISTVVVDMDNKLSPGIYVVVASSKKSVYRKRLIVK